MGKKKHRKFHRRTPEEQIADLEARIAELRGKGRGKDKFSPKAVYGERKRLELSAREYGDLVGVSQLTIYSWEKGRTAPRAAQLQKWLAVHGINKQKALRSLGVDGASRNGFSANAVYAERERLGLSAAYYGELVGVSALTIYNWEKEKTQPRQAQLEKWLAVRGIGKRASWRLLDERE